MLDGMEMLTEKGMYRHWLKRMGAELDRNVYGSDAEARMNEMFIWKDGDGSRNLN